VVWVACHGAEAVTRLCEGLAGASRPLHPVRLCRDLVVSGVLGHGGHPAITVQPHERLRQRVLTLLAALMAWGLADLLERRHTAAHRDAP
jgi:hypothetical protein